MLSMQPKNIRRLPTVFRQSDLVRAVRGAMAGGLSIARVEIETSGKIVLVAETESSSSPNDLDSWLEKRHAREA